MTGDSYALEISDDARAALEILCRDSGLAEPVVTIFSSSAAFPGASRKHDISDEQEIKNAISAIPLPLDFELVVQCVPKSSIPDEYISEQNGILINAPICTDTGAPTLHLDFREGRFLLLDDAGKDVAATIGSLVNTELRKNIDDGE